MPERNKGSWRWKKLEITLVLNHTIKNLELQNELKSNLTKSKTKLNTSTRKVAEKTKQLIAQATWIDLVNQVLSNAELKKNAINEEKHIWTISGLAQFGH